MPKSLFLSGVYKNESMVTSEIRESFHSWVVQTSFEITLNSTTENVVSGMLWCELMNCCMPKMKEWFSQVSGEQSRVLLIFIKHHFDVLQLLMVPANGLYYRIFKDEITLDCVKPEPGKFTFKRGNNEMSLGAGALIHPFLLDWHFCGFYSV